MYLNKNITKTNHWVHCKFNSILYNQLMLRYKNTTVPSLLNFSYLPVVPLLLPVSYLSPLAFHLFQHIFSWQGLLYPFPPCLGLRRHRLSETWQSFQTWWHWWKQLLTITAIGQHLIPIPGLSLTKHLLIHCSINFSAYQQQIAHMNAYLIMNPSYFNRKLQFSFYQSKLFEK